MKAKAQAFTIIELMVALSIASIIILATVTVLITAVKLEVEGRARAQMIRDLNVATQTLVYDLSFVGVGVPYGPELDDEANPILTAGAVNAARLPRPPVRIGAVDAIAFVGDMPYPNATLNGIAAPSKVKGKKDDKISVTSELATCAPPKDAPGGNYKCRTSQANLLGIGGPDCDKDEKGSPTCPWGLNKWQPIGGGDGDVDIILGAADGFYNRRLEYSGGFPKTKEKDKRTMIHFKHGFPNDHKLPKSTFLGGGFIAHLDRVFYSFEGVAPGTACSAGESAAGRCVLRRRHCWGPAYGDTSALDYNTDWPGVSGTPIRANVVPTGCAAGTAGTDWEEIVDGLEAFSFRYFHTSANELTPPWTPTLASQTRVVEFSMTSLRRNKDGRVMRQNITRRVSLPHPGGVVATPVVPLNQGGCDADTFGTGIDMCVPN